MAPNPRSFLAGALLVLAFPASAPAALAPTPRTAELLPARAFALRVSSVGHWAYGLETGLPGLEYPRPGGHDLIFAGGLWASARVGGELRVAGAEFGSDFVPGVAPLGVATRDDLRHRVFAASGFTGAGLADWAAYAVPQGAPGTPPGDAAVWTAFTDASGLVPEEPVRGGGRLTAELGLEVGLLGWSFDRPGDLSGVAWLRWRVVNRGAAPLDSLRLGLFLDPLASESRAFVASDTLRDMLYAWRQQAMDPLYGLAGPALGVRVLRGPVVGARALRPASVVAYPNGSDPAGAAQFADVLRGRLPGGAAMLDSVTLEGTAFWSPGDPVTGLEWVATGPPHAHAVLALEPFTLAPLAEAELVAAVVVGEGADRFAAITSLRERSDRALAHWRDGFASIPPREVLPLRAGPNPARGPVRIAWSVSGAARAMRLDVHDLFGRRVRTLWNGPLAVGDHVFAWDGRDDAGEALPQGVYVVRVRDGARDGRLRVTLLR